ncbi:MAG: ABC transporter permease subunit [Spirochaetaceae bacterium]|jgi:NitT/TauT family transport system permease protein|nr:ABC transporter permease subunit [Spirochaetaceae bacterium]
MKRELPVLWTLPGVLCLLVLWESAARFLGSSLLLPGPVQVAGVFFALVRTERFLRALVSSFLRVILGVAIAAPLGILAGIAAGLNRRADYFLKPLFTVISATPVMSVILIAFLWFGQERTPVFTAFLMVFPVMAANTVAGVRGVDSGLKELFAVYRIPPGDALLNLYFPAIVPFVLGGLRSSLSLCWKVVAAAEVLVQPLSALGTGMQNAKARLETPELFAWTVAAVIAAALSQVLLTMVLRTGTGRMRGGRGPPEPGRTERGV